jgi:hypothetical protein
MTEIKTLGECEITRIDAEMAKDLGLTEGDVLFHRPSDGAVFLHSRKDGQVFHLIEEFNESGEFRELIWKEISPELSQKMEKLK